MPDVMPFLIYRHMQVEYDEDEDEDEDGDGWNDGDGDPCPGCTRKYKWVLQQICPMPLMVQVLNTWSFYAQDG